MNLMEEDLIRNNVVDSSFDSTTDYPSSVIEQAEDDIDKVPYEHQGAVYRTL